MYYYIINPAAGRGAINSIQDKLRAKLNELGIAGEFAKTTGPGDATKMAKTAIEKGYNTIIAVGGDGTVNEVINGITRDAVAVGIIPIGNTNTMANKLGIYSWQDAVPTLANRRLTNFALMAAGQNFFLSNLTLGFETDFEKKVDTEDTGLKSRTRQFLQGLKQGQEFKTLRGRMKVDDLFTLEADLFTLTITNQKFITPLADNRLIVSFSDKPSRLLLTKQLYSLIKKDSPDDSATTRFLANRVVIDTDPPAGVQIDGKLSGRTPMAIRLTDRRIRFITGKQPSAFKPAGKPAKRLDQE